MTLHINQKFLMPNITPRKNYNNAVRAYDNQEKNRFYLQSNRLKKWEGNPEYAANSLYNYLFKTPKPKRHNQFS